ncbi:hypothetical protein BGW36DRAFT_387930 [Talaromyces proteolyticus]|uniref:NAD-dependent epimerase/dehydratase domain-containing protein n=1 Tax=Talaromyces proteolyticus TaxID=1131652 RepID=A0AAD4KLI0_9EURO|nr:uncharacterized protein BGW36DRAFT_387930 [Talaromyces proteolyticus]KAH8691242.1 hypothetical protein BGW36DRAFT_387930 [Talaromyces proteolyticus]
MGSSELVFITGGSGHIGFQVVVSALKAGYRVRAAVRSQGKADKIKSAPSIRALNAEDKLSFVEVADLTATGAYDKAVEGADYIIHVAAPISSSYKEGADFTEHFIEPSVKGTLGVLNAAKKTSSIRRVVITSSVAAIIPYHDFTSGKSETVYNETSRIPTPTSFANVFEAYAASKVAALNEAEEWIRQNKTAFSVIHIFPGFVIGKDELITDVKDAFYGTNKEVLTPVTGGDDGFKPSSSVHLDDVAQAHVAALNPGIVGNAGFVLSSGGLRGIRWEESLDVVAKNFPDAVQSGILANNGKIATLPVKIDASNTEKTLGLRLRPFDEQVKSVVGHYLELVGEGAG